MKKWVLCPPIHGQVIGALCGRMRVEMALGCQAPLDSMGKPTPSANKYLHMFNDDLKVLAEHDEDFGHQWNGDWRLLFGGAEHEAK